LTTEKCDLDHNRNETHFVEFENCENHENEGILEFYHISYSYLGTVAFVTTLLVANILSIPKSMRTKSLINGTTWFNRKIPVYSVILCGIKYFVKSKNEY